jgi:cytochrome c biogenesis protein CcmG, thiol:disulfide interchange protein DsbE
MTSASRNAIARTLVAPAARLPRAWYAGAATLPLLLLIAWALLLRSGTAVSGPAQIGELAPSFALADLDGHPVRLADLRGRPVIVNFWASWCGPCVDEFPLLLTAAREHAAAGVAVIGIVYRDGAAPARDFMSRMGASWPTALDPGDRVAARYGVIGAPETFFIDRSGVIVGRQIGQLTAADLDRALSQILKEE